MLADAGPSGLSFLPHGTCFLWQPELLWFSVLSDAAIALAYYSIPISLLYLVRKRSDVPFNGVLLLFGLFIVLCGTTHVIDIIDVWHPIYWFGAWVNVATAVVSIFTAVAMVRLSPQLLSLPSPITDVLTGLPNRLLLHDRLGQAVARARRSSEPFGLLFVDLDNFKHVNDNFGHGAGDQLLIAVAERFTEALRTYDTVARYGGDEFVVLLERATTLEYTGDVAARLLRALADPFTLGSHVLHVGASIGAVLSYGDGDVDAVIAEADRAMYDAKIKRRGGVIMVEDRKRPVAL